MLILGVESSCDETALALVRNGREVLSSLIASQVAVHAPFGGVVPEIASRQHLKALPLLFQELVATTSVDIQSIDAVAVTRGPGLIGALLVGVSFAKGLALTAAKPLVPVDHVHAHIHGALLGLDAGVAEYPALALVVSGGHTNLYYMPSPTCFELLASSVDDACGECFDKVAKLLGLAYPGGPQIEKLATQGEAQAITMPRMVERRSHMAFSYSGLKTYMANLINNEKHKQTLTPGRLADICAAFQEEALGQLARKLGEATRLKRTAKCVLVAGGVAANLRFRAILQHTVTLPCHFPQLRYCSDNAAMIAAYGYHLFKEAPDAKVFRRFDWDAYSRYDYANVIAAG